MFEMKCLEIYFFRQVKNYLLIYLIAAVQTSFLGLLMENMPVGLSSCVRHNFKNQY